MRIVTSERFNVSPREIAESWTMADVEQAHLTLDVLEDVQILTAPKPPRKR